MSLTPWLLAGAGMTLVLVAWATYLSTIARNAVPVKPTGTFALLAAGAGLAVLGSALGLRAGSGGPSILATFAVVFAAFFFVLFRLRHVPKGELQIEVGKPLLAFAAIDHQGRAFSSDSLHGRRVLLKFFRGSW